MFPAPNMRIEAPSPPIAALPCPAVPGCVEGLREFPLLTFPPFESGAAEDEGSTLDSPADGLAEVEAPVWLTD